jgi:hypothetical protein
VCNNLSRPIDPGQAEGLVSHSPVPASEEAREPLNDVQAYLVGMTASRAGRDLETVIDDAWLRWGGTYVQIRAALASAALGWCTDQSRRDREEDP